MAAVQNKFLILSLLLATSLCGISQQVSDSLKTLLSLTHDDTLYVDILNQLSKTYRWNDPLAALDYAVKAEKMAQNCDYHEGLALAYHQIAALYTDKGNHELALENYSKSFKIYEVFNNKKEMTLVSGNMGLIYQQLKQFDKALEFHSKSLELKKELNDTIGLAWSYGKIGWVFAEQGKYDKALIHYYNSLRLKETLNDKYGMANSHSQIGILYFEIESYDQAKVNLERSLLLFEDQNNKTGISETLLYLGKIYQKQQAYPKAIDALTRSLEINKELNNLAGMADAYLILGKIFATQKNLHKAYPNFLCSLDNYTRLQNHKGIVASNIALANYYMALDDYENTKVYLKNALLLAEKNSFLMDAYEISKLWATIYMKQENYFMASQLLHETHALSDSLYAKKLSRELTQVQMQNEFDKRLQQREIEALRKKTNRQLHLQKMQTFYTFLIAIVFLSAIMGLFIYIKYSTAKKKNTLIKEQQKQIESLHKQLQEKQFELENALYTKDKFLTIIGHDLRNPFNAINSFVSLVTEQTAKMNEAKLMKYLLLIKDAGAMAMSLLESILEWAKVQSGELVAHKENVSLNYILRGNVLLVKETARQKNIEIIEELEGNPTVHMDKNMINSVIRNLLSNTLKFTPDGGKVWVKTVLHNDEIKVLVRDSGMGISEEKLSNLFEPGIIQKDTHEFASSGLGLLVCKELLRQHHQELRVDSKINFGSTFWFYLPVSV